MIDEVRDADHVEIQNSRSLRDRPRKRNVKRDCRSKLAFFFEPGSVSRDLGLDQSAVGIADLISGLKFELTAAGWFDDLHLIVSDEGGHRTRKIEKEPDRQKPDEQR